MNVNEAIRKQRAQEENYSVRLFRTLSAWILPSSSTTSVSTDSSLLSDLLQLIKSSQLIPVVKTYLSNDAGNQLLLFFRLLVQYYIYTLMKLVVFLSAGFVAARSHV